MFKYWFTAPKGGAFSSFYMFNPVSRVFCRIRLELNRKTTEKDNGETGAFYRDYRVVGFSSRSNLDIGNLSLWRISTSDSCHRLVYESIMALRAEPEHWGEHVYDTSNAEISIHKGNPIIPEEEAILPGTVKIADLIALAKIAIKNKSSVVLTGKDATGAELAQAILTAIEPSDK